MTQKIIALMETNRSPKRKLKAGFNMYTSLAGIQKPVTDEDVFRALSSKPGCTEF